MTTYVSNPMQVQEWEEKLPLRVKGLLQQLRRRVIDAQEEAATARRENVPADSDTFLQGSGLRESDIPLGKRVGVRFQLDEDERRWMQYIDARIATQTLYGKTTRVLAVSGGDQFVVKPMSGNHVLIIPEER